MKMSNIIIYIKYFNPFKKHFMHEYLKQSNYEYIVAYNLRNTITFKDLKDLENSIKSNYQMIFLKFKASKEKLSSFNDSFSLEKLMKEVENHKINSISNKKKNEEIVLCNKFKYMKHMLIAKNTSLLAIISLLLMQGYMFIIPILLFVFIKKETFHNPINTITKVSYKLNNPYEITFYNFFNKPINIEIKNLAISSQFGSNVYLEDMKTNTKYVFKCKYFYYEYFHHLAFFICGYDFKYSFNI